MANSQVSLRVPTTGTKQPNPKTLSWHLSTWNQKAGGCLAAVSALTLLYSSDDFSELHSMLS